MSKQTIILILTLVTLSTSAMAYIHRNYVTKEVMTIFADQLTRIEKKVDTLIMQNRVPR